MEVAKAVMAHSTFSAQAAFKRPEKASPVKIPLLACNLLLIFISDDASAASQPHLGLLHFLG